MTPKLKLIPLEQVTRNPKQPRTTFPDEHIQSLAASIKARGLIQPITVRPTGRNRFEIVAGECRWRAHQLLKAKTIRAEIVEIDDREMSLRAIVENLRRLDMNPIEEARAFQTLLDQGYNQGQIVSELGLKSTAIVSQRLVLLNLTDDIQKLVISGNLSVTMAWGVAQVSPERQSQLVRDIAAGRLKTAEQVKHAGIAIREAEAQIDAFASAPVASKRDVAALHRLEGKVTEIAAMVQLGFRDGECVAAQRVDPGRAMAVAEKLAVIRKHALMMEHNLRAAATRSQFLLEPA